MSKTKKNNDLSKCQCGCYGNLKKHDPRDAYNNAGRCVAAYRLGVLSTDFYLRIPKDGDVPYETAIHVFGQIVAEFFCPKDEDYGPDFGPLAAREVGTVLSACLDDKHPHSTDPWRLNTWAAGPLLMQVDYGWAAAVRMFDDRPTLEATYSLAHEFLRGDRLTYSRIKAALAGKVAFAPPLPNEQHCETGPASNLFHAFHYWHDVVFDVVGDDPDALDIPKSFQRRFVHPLQRELFEERWNSLWGKPKEAATATPD